MNKEILKNLLRTSSVEFTYDEINKMLNDELEKSPEEMDTELVEICIDALSNYIDSDNETVDENVIPLKTKASKKSIAKKIIIAAAIVSIILMLSITVSANIFNIDLPEEIVKIFSDRISLNLTGESKEDNTLDENGLFSVFSSEKCVIESRSYDENKNETKMQFSVQDSKMHGDITILPYSLIDTGLEDKSLFVNVEQIKQLIVCKTELIIASSTNEYVMVEYNTDEKNILINFFDASMDEVIKFFENGTGE